jgi:hypothetical protein
MYDIPVLFAASRFRSLNHDEVIASRLAEFFAKIEKPEDVFTYRDREGWRRCERLTLWGREGDATL